MARGKLEPGMKQWKKGQSGNPLGARLHDKDLKMLKRLSREEIKEVGNLVLMNNVDELRAIGKDPGASALKTMVAAVCVRVIQKGDMIAFDLLLNRLVGKVRDEIEVSATVFAVPMDPAERKARLLELDRKLKLIDG